MQIELQKVLRVARSDNKLQKVTENGLKGQKLQEIARSFKKNFGKCFKSCKKSSQNCQAKVQVQVQSLKSKSKVKSESLKSKGLGLCLQ